LTSLRASSTKDWMRDRRAHDAAGQPSDLHQHDTTEDPEFTLDIPTSFNAIGAGRSRSRFGRRLSVDRAIWGPPA
jgi:hypothetical protein